MAGRIGVLAEAEGGEPRAPIELGRELPPALRHLRGQVVGLPILALGQIGGRNPLGQGGEVGGRHIRTGSKAFQHCRGRGGRAALDVAADLARRLPRRRGDKPSPFGIFLIAAAAPWHRGRGRHEASFRRAPFRQTVDTIGDRQIAILAQPRVQLGRRAVSGIMRQIMLGLDIAHQHAVAEFGDQLVGIGEAARAFVGEDLAVARHIRGRQDLRGPHGLVAGSRRLRRLGLRGCADQPRRRDDGQSALDAHFPNPVPSGHGKLSKET